MNIFENLVPLVAFYVPTGKEKMIGPGEIVPTMYGYSAKTSSDNKPYYVPTSSELEVSEGEAFNAARCCELAKTGYARDAEGNLIVAPPKPEADRVWRVVELIK